MAENGGQPKRRRLGSQQKGEMFQGLTFENAFSDTPLGGDVVCALEHSVSHGFDLWFWHASPGSKPLWYHPQRSRFSAQERFNQTIETLKSIRLAIPDCFIVLIDNSPIDREQAMRLESLANAFVNDVNNQDLRYWTDESEAKQIGEAMLLQQGLDALEEHEVMYEQLFKLSGRYMLNHKFNLQTYNNTHNVFKLARVGKSLNLHKPFYAYTCFFNIYYEHIHAFRAVLSSMTAELKAMIARNMSTFLHDDVESRLSLMLPEVVYVEELGVTQRISTWDAEDKDI